MMPLTSSKYHRSMRNILIIVLCEQVGNLKWKKSQSRKLKMLWKLTCFHMVKGLLIGIGTLIVSTSWWTLFSGRFQQKASLHTRNSFLPQYEMRNMLMNPKTTPHTMMIMALGTCGNTDKDYNAKSWIIMSAYHHSKQSLNLALLITLDAHRAV